MMGKNIFRTVVDEGASTFIMFIPCWKALVSPKNNTSKTLLEEFDGHMFHSHGIIITLPIELGSKTVFVVEEVVDAPLEYNLLLRSTWFYEMTAVVSSIFMFLCNNSCFVPYTLDPMQYLMYPLLMITNNLI
jgi:hypothetical protein